VTVAVSGCGSPKQGAFTSFATVDTDADWSPSGGLIVFASSREGGGIYLVRPDGKALRRWVGVPAAGIDWAPDGRRIVFEGVGGIYVLRLGERRPLRILGGGYSLPAWAPDGRRLAIVKQGRGSTSRIYLVRADGHGPRSGGISGTQPSWSPDGRRIAFQTADGRIVAVELANGRRHVIATGSDPAWSPNGKLIAFYSDNGLWVADVVGNGSLRRLASTEEMPDGTHVGGDPTWAADSHRIVFDLLHDRGRYSRRASSLSVLDEATGELGDVTLGGSAWDDPAWRDKIVGDQTF
jgi:TolB protein